MALAGNRVHATDILTGVWQSYTPTWTSSGTAPSLGNGSITGRYCLMGDLVVVQGKILMGSTTTFGTGNYSWSLPITSANALGGNSIIGYVWIRDNSAGDYMGCCLDGTTTFSVRPGASTFGGSSTVGSLAPMTWANTDYMAWQLNYEAA